jgi:hypothetical protein
MKWILKIIKYIRDYRMKSLIKRHKREVELYQKEK